LRYLASTTATFTATALSSPAVLDAQSTQVAPNAPPGGQWVSRKFIGAATWSTYVPLSPYSLRAFFAFRRVDYGRFFVLVIKNLSMYVKERRMTDKDKSWVRHNDITNECTKWIMKKQAQQ
jgi:hypothetical protein